LLLVFANSVAGERLKDGIMEDGPNGLAPTKALFKKGGGGSWIPREGKRMKNHGF